MASSQYPTYSLGNSDQVYTYSSATASTSTPAPPTSTKSNNAGGGGSNRTSPSAATTLGSGSAAFYRQQQAKTPPPPVTPSSAIYSKVSMHKRTMQYNNANNTLSAVEAAILRSSVPIEINDPEEIAVNGLKGIWANKAEVNNWRGELPIGDYQINDDPEPDIITKRSHQNLVYNQEVAIRYLRPPTPPPPGEIVITQETNKLVPPAPPLVIRQQPPRPITPPPLVIREAPPQPPSPVGRKLITISGKRLPPPPRKVVIERLAPLPTKPQSVIIERWLPYSQVKRRVIFQKAPDRDAIVVKPRNVIIQWEAPKIQVKKEFKDLGIIRANPAEYVARYGSTLKPARDLPPFVLEIKPPSGVVLAADHRYNHMYELEGDIQALRLVDLDREGLSEYKTLLQRLGIGTDTPLEPDDTAVHHRSSNMSTSQYSESYSNSMSSTMPPPSSSVQVGRLTVSGAELSSREATVIATISDIFATLDRENSGRLSVEEAEKLLLRLNSRLGRRFNDNEISKFFAQLDTNNDGQIDLIEFRQAFEAFL